ncbi:hypothetical protein V6259_17610 [Marinomonas sp. TI.3.20]|uniref:hypothetical protein n=1 Tax=Marinomonas sp. TI.3.20 TaxID=3121296 RepID=UPI003120079C
MALRASLHTNSTFYSPSTTLNLIELAETIKRASPVAWQNINFKGKYLFAEEGEAPDIEYLMASIEDYVDFKKVMLAHKPISSAITEMLSLLDGKSLEPLTGSFADRLKSRSPRIRTLTFLAQLSHLP